MRHVLCAVDLSEPSLRAARFATDLAGQCNADLLLLNVIRPPDAAQHDIGDYLRHEHNPDPPGVAIEEEARNQLSLVNERISGTRNIATTCEVRAGEAAKEIVATAREHAIDLIVVGHRGRSWLTNVLLGSVARTVVETAPCPVLIVR